MLHIGSPPAAEGRSPVPPRCTEAKVQLQIPTANTLWACRYTPNPEVLCAVLQFACESKCTRDLARQLEEVAPYIAVYLSSDTI
jgi:hypothetical protein